MNRREFCEAPIALIRGALMVACIMASAAWASHDPAVVSDIDGDFGTGFGSLSNSYVHVDGPNGDHPWYTFDATAGEIIDLELTTNFGADTLFSRGSFIWLFEVLDGSVDIGDADGAGLMLVAESNNTDFSPGPFLDQEILGFVAPSTTQYIVQVDSWLGGSGDYTLSLSRVPEPGSGVLLCLASLGLMFGGRKRS